MENRVAARTAVAPAPNGFRRIRAGSRAVCQLDADAAVRLARNQIIAARSVPNRCEIKFACRFWASVMEAIAHASPRLTVRFGVTANRPERRGGTSSSGVLWWLRETSDRGFRGRSYP